MNELALPDGLAPAQDIDASPDRSPAPRPRSLAGSTALIVLGMHRSGTSSLTGVLHYLGVALGANLMPASPDNPQGYWEHADVVRVDDDLLHGLGSRWDDVRPFPAGWEQGELARLAGERLHEVLLQDFAGTGLWGLKDPRLCRLMPLWRPLLAQWQVKPRFVLMLRHPLEVAASLAARDGLAVARSGLLWLRHVVEAEAATRNAPRAIVHYEDLIGPQGWRPTVARLARELGIAWPAAQTAESEVDSYLAPELRHHHVSDGKPGAAPEARLPLWLDAVYAAFRGGNETRLRQVCDTVRGELDRADGVFAGILGDQTRDLAVSMARQDAQARKINEMTTLLNRFAHEANELRVQASRKETEAQEQKQATGAVTPQGARMRQPLAMEEAYPKWIERRASTAIARNEWVAERVAQWPFMPKLALAMILPAGSEERVAFTLRSLLLQTVGDWELHVVAEGKMPAPFAAEKRLHWYEEGRGVDLLNRRLVDSRAHWIALIDAGDQLAPHALFSIADALFRHPEWSAVYSDEDRIDPKGQRTGPHFKPDFNLDLLRSMPYVGGLLAVRSALFADMGGFDKSWDGTEEYDFALRLAERLGAAGFGHVADVLYHRLTISGRSKRSMQEICADMPKALQAHFDRLGVKARAELGAQPHFCRVWYEHDGPEPMVSIIVPTKNQLALLKRCVETVLQKTDYQNYEVIIVDNGSNEADACAYLQAIEDKVEEIGTRLRVLRHPEIFNFSVMNNRAVRESARGEYICLLNNDAAPLDGAWLSEMMMARRPDVGIVGAKLFYPDGKIQHGGVILGVGWGSPADHPYNREPGNAYGYWGRLNVVQDFSVVTAACLVTRRTVYEEVKGLDEEAFAVAYNDVDYCLKVREAGYTVAWTPFARLLHEASASLKSDVEGKAVQEKNARFGQEQRTMYARWMPQIANDPAYNRNLSSLGFGFAVETEGAPTWDPDFRPRERVLVFPADREGCGEYRIIAPSRALFRGGVVHSYETMRLFTPPEVARMEPASIVFQRQLEWGQMEVINRVKLTTPKVLRIFEIDDLITNLPLKSAHRATISPDIGNRLKTALALCDRLVVSTEPLARQYGKLCGETIVVPNCLERARWDGLAPKRRPEGKPRVGWAGAVGHLGDLSLIVSVVEATAKEVDWVFFGMCPDKLKPHVAEFHEWVQLPDYAAKLATLDLDLAVAPLELNPFNEAKSNLRLLEYGILGYPVLCTDILPYQCDLPVTRISNRHRDWVKAIRDMVADREACRRAGEELRQAVLAEWMLEDHLDEWKKAWLP